MKKRIAKLSALFFLFFTSQTVLAETILLQENFDNANLSSRGWYDPSGGGGAISQTTYYQGGGSFECKYAAGATKCSGGSPQRHTFTASDSIYVSFWIKHSSNWVSDTDPNHPHMLYFLTTLDGDYSGLAYTYLTFYVEENQGYPFLAIQDGRNIDETKIGQNLAGSTENRAIAGCNGNQSVGQASTSCYSNGSVHWNGIKWKGPTAYFVDDNQKTNWHQVEAYIQMNTISNGIGEANGVVRYWYDGKLVIERNDVVIRTGQDATMKFNQFVLSPFFANPSSVTQTFWIDNLIIATARTEGTKPSPPARLIAQ